MQWIQHLRLPAPKALWTPGRTQGSPNVWCARSCSFQLDVVSPLLRPARQAAYAENSNTADPRSAKRTGGLTETATLSNICEPRRACDNLARGRVDPWRQ